MANISEKEAIARHMLKSGKAYSCADICREFGLDSGQASSIIGGIRRTKRYVTEVTGKPRHYMVKVLEILPAPKLGASEAKRPRKHQSANLLPGQSVVTLSKVQIAVLQVLSRVGTLGNYGLRSNCSLLTSKVMARRICEDLAKLHCLQLTTSGLATITDAGRAMLAAQADLPPPSVPVSAPVDTRHCKPYRVADLDLKVKALDRLGNLMAPDISALLGQIKGDLLAYGKVQ